MILNSNKIQYLFVLIMFVIPPLYSQTFQSIEGISGLGNLRNNNGVAVADYDGDLDLDIFVVAIDQDENGKESTFSRLFRNNSNGTFSDVTSESGLLNLFPIEEVSHIYVGLPGKKYGIAWGDYDNDGFPDICFTHASKVQLFHNQGNGTFIEKTIASGIKRINDCGNTGATWFDFNNDAYLDLYIADWGFCDNNNFYINNGDGTFNDVTIQFGLPESRESFMSLPFDFNDDGWMDLFVTNDFRKNNYLLINQGGVSFSEEAESYGLANNSEDMGIAIGDYNKDGFFDFYVTTVRENILMTNKGDNTFEDLALQNNVMETGWAWDTTFSDFDLDGDEDLFVVNGFKLGVPPIQQNVYFTNTSNQGNTYFTDHSSQVNLDDFTMSTGATPFDYDNDGDLDLFISNSGSASSFYENTIIGVDSASDLNWFKVVLQGTVSNRNAIGTTVTVKTATDQLKRYFSGVGFLSQSIQPVHFGLGGDTKILEVEIKWPSGLVEKYSNFESNKSILFIEGDGFQIYNIPEVIKKKGCTDPFSCSYDPDAIIDDGSCTYLTSNEITGNSNSGFLKTETYGYTPTSQNSSFSWNIIGGEILEGADSNIISVKWDIVDSGELTVRENSTLCSSDLATLKINLTAASISQNHSIARLWNEALLSAIRKDYARPTVHARNLFHTSIAMYDAWALFDDEAKTYLIGNKVHNFISSINGFEPEEKDEIQENRNRTLSYAVYRLLSHRFKNSPGTNESQALFDFLMSELGYSINMDSIDYSTGDPVALGNYIAKTIIDYGYIDGARELSGYDNAFYEPVNLALFPSNSGNGNLTNPNRWQPLSLRQFVDQSGNLIEQSKPDFLSPEWGMVNPFALEANVQKTLNRDGNDYTIYHDPEAPPYLDVNSQTTSSDAYKWGFSLVSIWGAHLDPIDNVFWDISPKSIGNIDIADFPTTFEDFPSFYDLIDGGDIGKGHNLNPVTNAPYEEQFVPRGDYARVLAEFWADGPDSETPPGHWFTLLNYVSDHELFEKKLSGTGKILDPLEWDVKSYFLMGGTMHDAAIAAWSIKGYYDYIRPVSAIRYMASLGQSTDMSKDNYHIAGIPLLEGYIETVEAEDALEGNNGNNIGKIKLYTWKGPSFISNPDQDMAGVGWILANNWWPYQRPDFVTPPFAGYVSGHSTYSRAAAEVMTLLTGSEFFPGGYGEFIARKNEFLVFEEGPSVDVKLQWATYRDASDQCSLSRIWGGIHPPADDIPGRLIGEQIGIKAFNFGVAYFKSEIIPEETPTNIEIQVYPNPLNSEKLYVTNTSKLDVFELVDMKGSIIFIKDKVFDSNTNQTQIEFSKTLASGVYILKINKARKLLVKN